MGILVLPIVCKRKSLPWLPPPSRLRSLLLQKGNTPYGSVDPSWLPSPPSNRCGFPSKSMTNLVPALSTGSASKHFLSFVRYNILCADSIFKLWVFKNYYHCWLNITNILLSPPLLLV